MWTHIYLHWQHGVKVYHITCKQKALTSFDEAFLERRFVIRTVLQDDLVFRVVTFCPRVPGRSHPAAIHPQIQRTILLFVSNTGAAYVVLSTLLFLDHFGRNHRLDQRQFLVTFQHNNRIGDVPRHVTQKRIFKIHQRGYRFSIHSLIEVCVDSQRLAVGISVLTELVICDCQRELKAKRAKSGLLTQIGRPARRSVELGQKCRK